MTWQFAIINNRLAEIYFDESGNGKVKIVGHCYVDKTDYRTKKEQDWIKKDTQKLQYSYHRNKYRLIKNTY